MLINSGKYLKEKWKTLEDLIWAYIKLKSPAELEANHNIFIYQLNQLEAFKVKKHWRLKEAYFNKAYTRYYYNLSANTSQ